MKIHAVLPLMLSLVLLACDGEDPQSPPAAPVSEDFYGTLEPFASQAVYFVVTDRFVNGDPANDQRDQGGRHRTFDIPLPPCDGVAGNIGYLGGDFKGLADNLDYIRGLGFNAVPSRPSASSSEASLS